MDDLSRIETEIHDDISGFHSNANTSKGVQNLQQAQSGDAYVRLMCTRLGINLSPLERMQEMLEICAQTIQLFSLLTHTVHT